MKKHNKLQALRDRASTDVKEFISNSYATARRIDEILYRKGMARKDFAATLGKSESEVSKWMTGAHNFTYLTIAKIESALGEKIIEVTSTATRTYVFQMDYGEEQLSFAFKGRQKTEALQSELKTSLEISEESLSMTDVCNLDN